MNIKPISMKCSQEQFDKIRPILEKNGITMRYPLSHFGYDSYLTNNYMGAEGDINNVSCKKGRKREVFEEWDQDTFLEYCGIKKIKKNMGYKTTVPITDVLKIHAVACDSWKKIIVDKYFLRVDSKQNITFTESEIDEMFDAATIGQIAVLREIFGEKKQVIDYDRLKTGSKVKIKCTEQHCDGIMTIDENEPVNIVFYKTPHFILSCNVFKSKGRYNSYITFNQKGKMVLFASHENTDYITEVIEY